MSVRPLRRLFGWLTADPSMSLCLSQGLKVAYVRESERERAWETE